MSKEMETHCLLMILCAFSEVIITNTPQGPTFDTPIHTTRIKAAKAVVRSVG